MTQTLELGGLVFEIRRSDRRKTLGLTVDRGGELVVHAPGETSQEEINKWVGKKLLWVHRKLALKEETAPKMRAPEYISGEAFFYLGRCYRLKIVERQENPLEFDGTRFTLRADAKPADEHFRDWYISTGKDWLKRRIESLSKRTGKKPHSSEIRDLGFRWGSCGRSGVVFFNWKLLQLPVRLADYVVAHELVHLIVRNHEPEFWSALGLAMPDYQKRKDALAATAKDYLVFGLRVL
jgi:predicted metal-dependent hydrolase